MEVPGTGAGGSRKRPRRTQQEAEVPQCEARLSEEELSRLQRHLESLSHGELLATLIRGLKERDSVVVGALLRLWPDALTLDPDQLAPAVVESPPVSPTPLGMAPLLPSPSPSPRKPQAQTPRPEAGPWADLPNAVAQNLFRRVFVAPAKSEQEAAASARLVCRSWSGYVLQPCKELVLRHVEGQWLLDSLVPLLRPVESVDFGGAVICVAINPDLTGLTKLKTLKTSYSANIWKLSGGPTTGGEPLFPALTALDLSAVAHLDGPSWFQMTNVLPELTGLAALKLPIGLSDPLARDLQRVTARLHSFAANRGSLSTAGLEALQLSPSILTSLHLESKCVTTPESLALISKLTRLEELSLLGGATTDEDAQEVTRLASSLKDVASNLPFLHTLSYTQEHIPEQTCDGIAEALLPLSGTLTSLNLCNWSLGPRGFLALGGLESLTRLRTGGTFEVGNIEGLRPLAGTLEHLDLSQCICPIADGLGLAALRDFSSLTHLDIRHSNVTAAGLEAIASCPSPTLRNLQLVLRSSLCEGPESSLEAVMRITSLRNLDLAEVTGFSDNSLVGALLSLPELESLTLSGTGAGDATLAALSAAHPSRLRTLRMAGCRNVTDEGVQALSDGLPAVARLRELDLSHCSMISDVSLTSIAAAACCSSTLKKLSVQACPGVTDAGVASLASLQRLSVLNLAECPQVTAPGIAALQHVTSLRRVWVGERTRGDDVVRLLYDLRKIVQAGQRQSFLKCCESVTRMFDGWQSDD